MAEDIYEESKWLIATATDTYTLEGVCVFRDDGSLLIRDDDGRLLAVFAKGSWVVVLRALKNKKPGADKADG